jgi:RHH-type transcriptional regulator, proline utilization regulon repressor / proline dehydrogenase / delta 1-pyrroline-5-carboxylate dehydrogenase
MNIKQELHKISEKAFCDEIKLLQSLLLETTIYQQNIDVIDKRAKRYITEIRATNKLGGVEEFINQFGLQEKEAIGLLCLAEALLRIPDNKTVDELISDKLKGADWKKFIKEKAGFSVYSKAWGLMLSSNLAEFEDSKNPIENILHRLSEPSMRLAFKAAMQILGKEFVAGTNIKKALKNTKSDYQKGYCFSYDMLGEGARTEKQAQEYLTSYLDALTALKDIDKDKPLLERPNISVKLSALHPRYEYLQQDRVMSELYDRIKQVAMLAQKYGLTISLDAEESYRLDSELELYAKLISDNDFKDFQGIGFVLQAYQKRAIPTIKFLINLAQTFSKKIPIRLVKGAYWDSEIKWAQMEGLSGYPVFTRKSHTDVSFLACSSLLLNNTEYFYPQFATHNALTASAIITLAEKLGKEDAYEFQRLYGMGSSFYDQMIAKRPCRIYSPVGSFRNLLPYLIRRLMENGVNSNFINQLIDDNIEVKELLKNPIEKAEFNIETSRKLLKLPQDIFDGRVNSLGYSLGNKAHMKSLKDRLAQFQNQHYIAGSIINGKVLSGKSLEVRSPYDQNQLVGNIALANYDDLNQALKIASESATDWRRQSVESRAKILENMADLIKESEVEFISLLMREAGKTLNDTIAEIREAIDFCNYYAMQARALSEPEKNQSYTGEDNYLSYHGRGVFACISPWNFPLAIYLGQVVAALVSGNSVLAKPAESTSIIAFKATELLYKAGVPKNVLQFVPADGKLFGEVILSNNIISGVAFTGSTATAHVINRTLAKRDSPIAKLIAETGGQNCMIVDSSALLEQATDDIINSSFLSSGQRCSALRVLYVQDEIADDLTELIKGAMAELQVSDPNLFATDLGPVINQQAQDNLNNHIKLMKKKAKFIANVKIQGSKTGFFVEPHFFEIGNINQLKQENFGPILHLIRYQSKNLNDVISDINSTGYGLTFGIHSRIQERIDYISSRIRAGNIYINRNITGAAVGVQPFGGMLLSGTGPKAGGPEYLKAFMTEQNISNNITAIGGNLALMNY